MWRRDVGGEDGTEPPAEPVMIAGTNFLPATSVGTVMGHSTRRRGRGLGLVRRMWRSRGEPSTVTCIACGSSVARSEAREYDKHGDRWSRDGKQFEFLCKPCHGDIDHQPRGDVEPLLVEFEATDRPRTEFLSWYCERVTERHEDD